MLRLFCSVSRFVGARCLHIHSACLSLSPALSSAEQLVRSQDDAVKSSQDEPCVPVNRGASSSRVYFLHSRSNQELAVREALRCLRAYSLLPSPETLELSLQVNMLLKKNKRREPFRGTLVYPTRFGVEATVLLIAEDEVLANVKGANFSGGKEMIDKLEKDPKSVEFDVCVCTPIMYETMKHLQRVLRAKMPSPRRGTVVLPGEIAESIRTFQQSKVFRCSKYGVVNMAIGMLDFEDSSVEANIRCLLDSVSEHRGSLSKSLFVEHATLSSSFGPGFPVKFQDVL